MLQIPPKIIADVGFAQFQNSTLCPPPTTYVKHIFKVFAKNISYLMCDLHKSAQSNPKRVQKRGKEGRGNVMAVWCIIWRLGSECCQWEQCWEFGPWEFRPFKVSHWCFFSGMNIWVRAIGWYTSDILAWLNYGDILPILQHLVEEKSIYTIIY